MNKKTTMIISFVMGTLIFATTAMAEVASKSGYEQLKDAMKYSSATCSEKLSNYTMEISMVMKDNDKIITSSDNIIKYDRSKDAKEDTSTYVNGITEKGQGYFFADKSGYINYNSEQDTYYVTETNNEKGTQSFKDPFKEKTAGDLERIADALVGNLKDSVVVSEKSDGSKELSGTLSDAQIPAIANALVSFQLKQQFGYSNKTDNISPTITKDVYVKEIKGNMALNKDGLIQSVLGTGILSGKDKAGAEHNLTFEVLLKIVDVNSTVVKKPDLSGKHVQTYSQTDYNKLSNPEMYVGTYKSNITIKKDGKFQKIGEAFVVVESINDKNAVGRYHEEYNKGFENYAANKKDFKFDAKTNDNSGTFYAEFDGTTNTSGKVFKGNMNIDPHSSNIYFNINNEVSNGTVLIDGTYSRVFD